MSATTRRPSGAAASDAPSVAPTGGRGGEEG